MKLRDLSRMLARAPRGAARWHTYADFREEARRRLPKMVFDFVEGGAEGELTIAANRAAIDGVELAPSYMVDVADREVSTTVLGQPVSLPFLLAPAGLATLVHREGELAAARAAAAAGDRVRGEHRLGLTRWRTSPKRPPMSGGGSSSICGRAPRWCGCWSTGLEMRVTRPWC